MANRILGISAYYHDSAAVLLVDGQVTTAAQEERFSRKKHDARFPGNAISYCLQAAGTSLTAVDYIVFYDKPLLKFERLLETYLTYAPKGFRSFVAAMPIWLKDKLFLKQTLRAQLAELAGIKESQLPSLLFGEHHESHAASAFYPSPYERAGVLCMDGVGEWATTSVWLGDKGTLTPQWQIDFPHSLGLLYSAFTYYTGFKVNSGEYKLMGLAPYGEARYVDHILNNLLDLKQDGTFRLDMSYFNYATGLTMTTPKFHDLFGGAPREPETGLSQKEMDIARSIQLVTEEAVLRLCKTVHKELDTEFLCLAGGVALNCVANGRIAREGPFRDIWIQPAAGDAGGALGAALTVWHHYLENPRTATDGRDKMRGSFLGCCYSNDEIETFLDSVEARYVKLDDKTLLPQLAELLDQGKIIGWFNGRMEFGPRALGARSIIGDPRSPKMQSIMNLKIKYRESFRPFAPAAKAERVSEWFEMDRPSPYMLLVAPVRPGKRCALTTEEQRLIGLDRLKVKRSDIPAVTHVDYSARVQTVHAETNPRFHQLISHFEDRTGCPIVVNTSFNVRGEPLVRTPEEAYRCFMRTEMDYLVMENVLLSKADQPLKDQVEGYENEFALD